jgi:hypothetical protein
MAYAKNVAGGIWTGAAVYSEGVNMLTYGISSGNDKFVKMVTGQL